MHQIYRLIMIFIFFFSNLQAQSPCGNDCPNIEMIDINSGIFQMGKNLFLLENRPVRQVTLQSYQLSKSEVTVGQYRACVNAGVCDVQQVDLYKTCNWSQQVGIKENYPMNCVDWTQARTFAKWVGMDLPTEAEWEYAAKSMQNQFIFPWGSNEPSCDLTNFKGNCHNLGTEQVCSHQLGNTQQNLCDMSGNVWEWVLDEWHSSYVGAFLNGRAWCSDSDCTSNQSRRIYRGGSYDSYDFVLRNFIRNHNQPTARGPNLGFRLSKGSQNVVCTENCTPCGDQCPNVDMVFITAGSFTMGSQLGAVNEQPEHLVNLSDSFFVSKSEITVGQYKACVNAGICSLPSSNLGTCNWQYADRDQHPINCITWTQARTFANWLGGDLPSEAQWEYVAKSQGIHQTYPWGNHSPSCISNHFIQTFAQNREVECYESKSLETCYFDGNLYEVQSNVGVLIDNAGGDTSFASVPLTFIIENGDGTTTDVSIRETTIFDDPISPSVLEINSFTIDQTATPATRISSAIAKVKAINEASELTGIHAIVTETRTDDDFNLLAGDQLANPLLDPSGDLFLGNSGSISAISIGGDHLMVINGVILDDVEVENHDASGALRHEINRHYETTGVEAEVSADGKLVLIAKDGRNIIINYKDSSGSYNSFLANSIGLRSAQFGGIENWYIYGGKITLLSKKRILIKGSNNASAYDISEVLGGIVNEFNPITGSSILEDTTHVEIFDTKSQDASNLTNQNICDMADNVSEWVLDDYASSYVGISNEQANCSQSDCSNLLQKVVRGGSWISKENELRNTFRKSQNGNESSPYIGFRIIQ